MEAPPRETSDRDSLDREWWLRTLVIFQAPRAVFAALRNDAPEDAEARQEPVLALVLLAGMAGVLLAPSTGRLLDESLVDNSTAVVAVLIFVTGGLYGTATYWLGGAALYVGLRGAGSKGRYLRARHILAFAAAPLVLGLVFVWPIRIAVYGSDLFRSGEETTARATSSSRRSWLRSASGPSACSSTGSRWSSAGPQCVRSSRSGSSCSAS